MLIKTFELGQLEANCYIVTDEDTLKTAIIDPGDESNTVLDYVESNHLTVEHIFLTHGHFDHTGAAFTVADETGAKLWINRNDMALSDSDDPLFKYVPEGETHYYSEGDTVVVGNMDFHVIETPGHSKGSVSLLCGEALFTGDTLFKGGAGRVDLPGGDMMEIMLSLKKLASLPGDYEVYPGHMETTRLDVERNENPFVSCAMGVKE